MPRLERPAAVRWLLLSLRLRARAGRRGRRCRDLGWRRAICLRRKYCAQLKAGPHAGPSRVPQIAKLATLVEASWLRLACVAPARVRVTAAAEDAPVTSAGVHVDRSTMRDVGERQAARGGASRTRAAKRGRESAPRRQFARTRGCEKQGLSREARRLWIAFERSAANLEVQFGVSAEG